MLIRSILIVPIGLLLGIGLALGFSSVVGNDNITLETVVCGAYVAPGVVMGEPTRLEITGAGISIITFSDNYTLTSRNAPSLFLNKLTLFTLSENKITGIALVSDKKFHPCPKS